MTGNGALLEQMRTAVEQWVTLDDAEWREFAFLFHVRSAQAGQYLSLPGDTAHELLFLGEGLLRFYYVDEDGTETNMAFLTEEMFAGCLAAFTLNLPVVYGIQALESSTLLAASYADLAALYERQPTFERFGRRLAEWLLARQELRTRSFLQEDATERYLAFARANPDLIRRVPQYHIASYLGITEVSLSRLKRSLLVRRAS